MIDLPDVAYAAPLANLLHALHEDEDGAWSAHLTRVLNARGEVTWRLAVHLTNHQSGTEIARLLGATPHKPRAGMNQAYWSGWYNSDTVHIIVEAPRPRANVTLRTLARDLADQADQAGQHQVAEHAREAAAAADQDSDTDEDGECEGHESLDGAHMGEAVYCDGSCRGAR